MKKKSKRYRALAEKIEQFLTTGKIKKHEEVLKSVPSGLIDMMNIPGMGPKKASKLYNILKIDSIESLEKAANEGRIRNLEGFGEKSEKDILSGIDLLKKGRERMFLGDAIQLSKQIVDYLLLWHLRKKHALSAARAIRGERSCAL